MATFALPADGGCVFDQLGIDAGGSEVGGQTIAESPTA
jgi:hypothetical protein